jgi:hypothetical protein
MKKPKAGPACRAGLRAKIEPPWSAGPLYAATSHFNPCRLDARCGKPQSPFRQKGPTLRSPAGEAL